MVYVDPPLARKMAAQLAHGIHAIPHENCGIRREPNRKYFNISGTRVSGGSKRNLILGKIYSGDDSGSRKFPADRPHCHQRPSVHGRKIPRAGNDREIKISQGHSSKRETRLHRSTPCPRRSRRDSRRTGTRSAADSGRLIHD